MNREDVIDRVKKLTEIAIPWYCEMQYITNKHELVPRIVKDLEKSKDKEVLAYLEENLK